MILELPLRAFVFFSQVKAGRWVRNGRAALGPAAVYGSNYWHDHG